LFLPERGQRGKNNKLDDRSSGIFQLKIFFHLAWPGPGSWLRGFRKIKLNFLS
jgi:hypothetical protein